MRATTVVLVALAVAAVMGVVGAYEAEFVAKPDDVEQIVEAKVRRRF